MALARWAILKAKGHLQDCSGPYMCGPIMARAAIAWPLLGPCLAQLPPFIHSEILHYWHAVASVHQTAGICPEKTLRSSDAVLVASQ